jgi:hypothetical protein
MSFNTEQHYNLLLEKVENITAARPVDYATADKQTETLELIARGIFQLINGNSVEFTYVAGTFGNLVATATYKTGATTIVTLTYSYNVNDEVTSINAI